MTNIKKQSKTTERVSISGRLLGAMPGLRVLREYKGSDLGPDVLSGLVICLVLIPSVLAYAELAGSGPVGGIYAAVAATIAYFLFASSRHMNVGPDGAVALLAGVVILPLTGGDPANALIASSWLAVFTGIILVAAAALRLGVVASFLSTPVLLGYLNGAAFVIIVSQWGKLFGIDLEQEGFIQRLIEWVQKLDNMHTTTLAVGAGVIVLLVIAKWLIPRLPPLVPVFFIMFVASYFVDFKAMDVGVIGEIRELTPQSVGFTLDLDDIAKLAVGALGLAMLIFPEGVLLGRAMAEKHDYEVNADRELFALGSANLASGAFLGFSVGGSQTRTLLNSASGGRTQVANLVSAILLVAFIVFAADLLTRFPKVAIAAILVYTGIGLIDIAGIRRLWRLHRKTAWIAITTMGAVIFVGVLPGILLGTAMSIGILLAELARPNDALLGRVEGSEDLHDVGDDEKAEGIPGLVVYRFYGPLIFANVSYFIERLQGFIDGQEHPVQQVIIDASAIPSLDYTAAEKLQPYLQKLADQGIELGVARAHLPLREMELGNEMDALFPEERNFATVADAVAAYKVRGSTR
jgi:SulP family sulfate permease